MNPAARSQSIAEPEAPVVRAAAAGVERPPDILQVPDVRSRSHLSGLPPDLLAQAAWRLRVIAALYAFVFFVSNPLTTIFFPVERAQFFSSFLRWGPSTLSIGAALLVVALTRHSRVTAGTVIAVGLVFEVAGSFGIAASQYLDVSRYSTEPPWAGLSWVAVWMLGFTVMVPTPPRLALLTALASASSVPLVVGYVAATNSLPFLDSPLRFIFQIVVPYLLVVLVAYVAAHVIYRLGTELKRARELGSYRLIERLSWGGMGEVWRAEHRLLARPAAVKLMRPELLGQSDLAHRSQLHARFEREAQATACLRSPHTIQLYDFGVADDGSFYYVMELLDGFNLETLVERFGPLPPERAIFLLQQVCHSLAEAHAAGMIHRDIKPANVYVCRNGRDLDFVKVLDFGLVKSLDSPESVTLANTITHAVAGTPAFMPPEQALANRPLDARADIYAVGCLAYWLVTGQLVFAGRTVMETIVQHTQATPVRPSERTELPIPAALDQLILDCLAKSPDDRPDNAEAVAARLAAMTTSSAWTPERARQWWEVHHPPKAST